MTADRIKTTISPAEFYLHEIPSMPTPRRSAGWVDGGFCPFHDDRHKGNFRVNLSTGSFKCFSCGAGGGDIIAFQMRRGDLTFREALESFSHDWRL
jgi:DNA primase